MGLNSVQLMGIEYIITLIGLFLGYKCFSLKKNNMNYFWRFIVSLNLFLFVNIPVRLSELKICRFSPEMLYFLYSASVVVMTFLMFYWFLFIMKQINSPLTNTSLKIHISFIPAFCSIPLCIVNFWTGWLFYIDEASTYHRGAGFGYVLQGIIAYGYLVVLIGILISYWLCRKELKTVKNCIISSIPAIVGIAFQNMYGGSYLWAGVTVTALIMYVEVCLDRQKAIEMSSALAKINQELVSSNDKVASVMHTFLGISGIYHIIYEVNVEKDEFTSLKAPDQVIKFTKKFSSARECLKNLPAAMFYKEDLPEIEGLYDMDALLIRLEHTNSCFGDGRGLHINQWLRTNVVVTERDKNKKVLRFVIFLENINEEKERQKKMEETLYFAEKAKEMKEMFVQTAETLASAIDAKDPYTHGHSIRVAQYSRRIAEMAHLSDEVCEMVYFSALLHDVGKIGIPDWIIQKQSKLTEEEMNEIKTHPVKGREILAHIRKLPYLTMGCKYHHERYDGRGYPEGLKATDIPEIARVIAVADAYDAMTSKRSYREPMPQDVVRNEIKNGIGAQFDPVFGKVMLDIIDQDSDYELKQSDDSNDLYCFGDRKVFYEGIILTSYETKVHFRSKKLGNGNDFLPSIIIFDAVDSRIHIEPQEKQFYLYSQYCEVRLDGKYENGVSRKLEVTEKVIKERENKNSSVMEVDLTITKLKDHVYMNISDGYKVIEVIAVLPDNSCFAYLGLTGNNCHLTGIKYEKSDTSSVLYDDNRILEEVTYDKLPDGDIPNLQVDCWRTASTRGIPVYDELKLNFHMRSLPFARLIWHCPFVVLFDSDDGLVRGPNYREFAFVRFDGESWQEDPDSANILRKNETSEYKNWDEWKKGNKEGRDIELTVKRSGNQILLSTSCGGLQLDNITTVNNGYKNLYISLTGDQVILESIKINKY